MPTATPCPECGGTRYTRDGRTWCISCGAESDSGCAGKNERGAEQHEASGAEGRANADTRTSLSVVLARYRALDSLMLEMLLALAAHPRHGEWWQAFQEIRK